MNCTAPSPSFLLLVPDGGVYFAFLVLGGLCPLVRDGLMAPFVRYLTYPGPYLSKKCPQCNNWLLLSIKLIFVIIKLMIIILLILTRKKKKDCVFCLAYYRDDLTSVILVVTRAQTFKNISPSSMNQSRSTFTSISFISKGGGIKAELPSHWCLLHRLCQRSVWLVKRALSSSFTILNESTSSSSENCA